MEDARGLLEVDVIERDRLQRGQQIWRPTRSTCWREEYLQEENELLREKLDALIEMAVEARLEATRLRKRLSY